MELKVKSASLLKLSGLFQCNLFAEAAAGRNSRWVLFSFSEQMQNAPKSGYKYKLIRSN